MSEIAVDNQEAADKYPYASWTTLIGVVDRLKEHGVPQVFDKSFFNGQSGSLIAQMRGALKFLGLMDDERRPTPSLHVLVAADDAERKDLLRAVAKEKYAEAIQLGEANGTQGQLQDVFRRGGLSGATVTKAVAFYLGLAEYLDLPVSKYFTRTRSTAGSGGSSPRRTIRRKRPQAKVEPPRQAQDASPLDAKKSAYIDMLMNLAANNDGVVQTDLLDRIERALGYENPTADKENSQVT